MMIMTILMIIVVVVTRCCCYCCNNFAIFCELSQFNTPATHRMAPTAPKKLQPWKLITEAFKSFLIACIFAAAVAVGVAVAAVVAATHFWCCCCCELRLLPAAADDVVVVLHFISAGKLFSISAANRKRVRVLASSVCSGGGVAVSQKLPLSLYAFDGFDCSHSSCFAALLLSCGPGSCAKTLPVRQLVRQIEILSSIGAFSLHYPTHSVCVCFSIVTQHWAAPARLAAHAGAYCSSRAWQNLIWRLPKMRFKSYRKCHWLMPKLSIGKELNSIIGFYGSLLSLGKSEYF